MELAGHCKDVFGDAMKRNAYDRVVSPSDVPATDNAPDGLVPAAFWA